MASLASNSGSVEHTKKVYFYDDDIADNWSIKGRYNAGPFLSQEQKNEAEKKVKFIAIPVGQSGGVDEKYLSGGSDELNESAYLQQKSSLERGWYFPESGVKTHHLEQLKNDIWEDKVLAVVFDFDRTLQLFEGALVGSSKSLNECLNTLKGHNLAPNNWGSNDLATFILHDKTDSQRIDNLMMTLQLAEHKKIPIFIITNNALPKNNQQGVLTDLFKFLGVTVEKDFILGGGTAYPKTKYQVILDKVIPFAEGVEEERKRAFAEEVEEERKRATTGSSKTGETKSDEQSKKTSSKSENVSKKPPSSSFGGSKKTKKRKFRKKKRKTKRKKSILKSRKKKKKNKKKKSTKRKY